MCRAQRKTNLAKEDGSWHLVFSILTIDSIILLARKHGQSMVHIRVRCSVVKRLCADQKLDQI
jgi:hypothetical protein